MATVITPAVPPAFENGDRMTRAEFHHIYDQMPENVRAELIGGIVYVASPLRRKHGTQHLKLAGLFAAYEDRTPGVEAADNGTVLLGELGEPQPDLSLRILPEYGGQSRTTSDDYVDGPPEFIVEVALSSRGIDLHAKYDDYRRYGVLEYLVVCLTEAEFRWFDLKSNQELEMPVDQICRVHTFPGLWINAPAFFARSYGLLVATLEQGLATREHAEFVDRLAATVRGQSDAS